MNGNDSLRAFESPEGVWLDSAVASSGCPLACECCEGEQLVPGTTRLVLAIDASRLIQRIFDNCGNGSPDDYSGACWPWLRKKRSKEGYGRINVYIFGKHKTLYAHRLLFACFEAQKAEIEWWEALLAMDCSGLEVDHMCNNPECCNIDHLDLVTPKENCARRGWRSRNGQRHA